MTFCCAQMKRQVEYICDVHPDLSECPDSLVVRVKDTGEFGLRIHDGGSSFIAIQHCPWCGSDLLERVSNKELGPPAVKIAGFQLWVPRVRRFLGNVARADPPVQFRPERIP